MSDSVPALIDPAENVYARYRSQINNMMIWAGVAYWEFDVAKGVFDISADFVTTLGYKPEDLVPVTIDRWQQIVHPDDWQYALSMLEKIAAGHIDFVDIAYRMRAASGEWQHFRSRGGVSEVCITDKKVIKVSGTLQNITDQKIASMRIQRRDRLLAAVNDTANVLLTATPKNFDQSISEVLQILGSVTEVDRVYVWKNEWIEEEMYSTQVYEWSPNIKSLQASECTTQVKINDVMPGCEERLAAGECINGTVQDIFPVVQELPLLQDIVSLLMAPVTFRGEFWGFIGFDDCQCERIWDGAEASILKSAGMLIASAIQRHQTELDLIQERRTLDWILETSPIAIATTLEGKVHHVNKRSKEFFAIKKETPVSEILAKILGEHQNRIDRNLVIEEIREKGAFTRDIQFLCIDGVVRDFLLTTVPFKPDGLQKLISWIVDITELKETERALIQARNKAEDATKAKSEFLARMSHEIRTPMNAILGMIYLCLKTELNDKQWDYLEKTQSAAHNLLGIINEILDFSKIEAGKLELESVPFSLKTTINEVIDTTRTSAEEKGLKLIAKIDHDIGGHLVGDPLRLRQVLLNLISNAVKFTEKGEVLITAKQDASSLDRDRSDKIGIVFEVQDTGIGLKPEQIKTIFESFAQGDGSTTRKYGGTGLGLAIVKNLVELMGGTVGVSSILGQGTTFSFKVVFAKTHAEPELSTAILLQQRRVLIVDDDPNALEILMNLMQASQMQVLAVRTGTEALKMLTEATELKAPFELLLIDWRMPRMDGVETVRHIRQSEKDIVPPHIVMISAHDRQECLRLVKGLNVFEVLAKPIQPDTFKDTLKAVFSEDLSQKTDEIRADIRGAKILLADDNKINQLVASELLKMLGVEVTIANDGLEAVEAVKKNTFDLVLMDIQMPKMDGLTATRTIRNLGKPEVDKLPILAMTANAADTDYQKSLEVGMNDHLTKPIDPDKLRITLEKWIVR